MMDASSLTPAQLETLTLFKEITQINDDALCIDMLIENDWNVQVAVDNFVQGRRQSTTSNNDNSNASTTNANTNSNIVNSTGNQATRQMSLWNPLRWLFQFRPTPINPELDTRKFLAEFDLTFGSQHPTFSDRSYQSTVVQAFQESRFLLVYIHSPMHEDTNRFCRQVLCTQSFSRFVDQEMLVWAGRVWDPEAYSLSIQLRATTFPFLALLVCQTDRAVQVVRRFQGITEEAALTEALQNSVNSQRATLNRVRAETLRREESVRLREQQDREYREAAEEQMREAERIRREEEEAARRAEEERVAKLEAEAIELSLKLHREATISAKRQKLTATGEPDAGPDVATVRFQLPASSQAAKLTRRFRKTDTIEHLCDFLAVHFADSGTSVVNFSLSTHFPKQELTDLTMTVESAGLFPRGMLYVQDVDA